MRRQPPSIALRFFVISTVVWLMGQAASKRMSKGGEDSAEFTLVTFMRGRQFKSRAEALRSGKVIGSMGGCDIDLREATLDPAGAELTLTTSFGGARVVVRDDWRVKVDTDAVLGEVQVRVTPAAELPDDAPRLHVRAVTRGGGGLITTDPSTF